MSEGGDRARVRAGDGGQELAVGDGPLTAGEREGNRDGLRHDRERLGGEAGNGHAAPPRRLVEPGGGRTASERLAVAARDEGADVVASRGDVKEDAGAALEVPSL